MVIADRCLCVHARFDVVDGVVLGYLKTRSQASTFDTIDLVDVDRIVVNPSGQEPPSAAHKEV